MKERFLLKLGDGEVLNSIPRKNKTVFYFRTVHVATLTLLKTNSCTFCKIHSHSHFKLQLLKIFVKHLIKNPTCFGHNYLTILRGRPLCKCYYYSFSLLASSIWYVAVCCLCVCVSGVPALKFEVLNVNVGVFYKSA
jgi:hypothetical protein